MATDVLSSPTPAPSTPTPRAWSAPRLVELPKLTSLTLASAIGGGGGTGGGGSTVFGLLLAASFLAGCSADRGVEPSAAVVHPVASIACVGNVTTKQVRCLAPNAAPGQEIIGGQGTLVALRSSNVAYNNITEKFTFDVTVQNLSAQTLGVDDGIGLGGVNVFFESAPVATGGSGTITVENAGFWTFTAPGQDYYAYPDSLLSDSTSASESWQFGVPVGVTSFSFQVMVAAKVADQGGVLRWAPIEGSSQRGHGSVISSSATDWMTVGQMGFAAHYTGGKWVTLPKVTDHDLSGLVAVAPGEYLAIADGMVFRFKNKVWTKIYQRGDFEHFRAVWAKPNMSVIVAVGSGGNLSRYSGGVWKDTLLTTLGLADLVAVSGDASGAHISTVTGSSTSGELFTSTAGGSFTPDPTLEAGNFCGDILYDAPGHFLLSCLRLADFLGAVVSSTGDTVWTHPLALGRAIRQLGPDSIVVGWVDAASNFVYADLVSYSSLPATTTTITTALDWDISGFAAPSDTEFFATIFNNGAKMFRWDGTAWVNVEGDDTWITPDVWGVGDTAWAVDGGGGFFRIDDGVVTPLPGQAGLIKLWGISSTSFLAIDATDVYSSDGTTGWNHEYAVGGAFNHAVWADPTGNAVLVLGSSGRVGQRINGVWNTITLPGPLGAVWGCDEHNAWIGMSNGQVYKWVDGVATLDATFGSIDFHAVGGTSCTDVWVGGVNGKMFHWDGVIWTDRSAPSGGFLLDLAPLEPGVAFVVGGQGYGARFSTSGAAVRADLPSQLNDLLSIWKLENGEVIVAGKHMLFRGLR